MILPSRPHRGRTWDAPDDDQRSNAEHERTQQGRVQEVDEGMFGHVLEGLSILGGVACRFDRRPKRGRPLSRHEGPSHDSACQEPDDDRQGGEPDEAVAA